MQRNSKITTLHLIENLPPLQVFPPLDYRLPTSFNYIKLEHTCKQKTKETKKQSCFHDFRHSVIL
jgi:hypothetical protein